MEISKEDLEDIYCYADQIGPESEYHAEGNEIISIIRRVFKENEASDVS